MAKAVSRRALICFPIALSGVGQAAAGTGVRTRSYRIDVAIAPLGILLFSRKGVGRGAARLEYRRDGGERRWYFEFGAASCPERVQGIRQMGFFEEELIEADAEICRSRYFGFLTAAPEAAPSREVLEAVKDQQQRPQYCCAVEGKIEGGRSWFAKTYEAPLPADASFETLAGVRRVMQSALEKICGVACRGGTGPLAARRTFLGALAEAVLGDGEQTQTRYQYGDRILSFRSRRKKAPGQTVVEAMVSGKNRHGFRLSFAESTEPALPERIEYQPKNWLRLTLEAEKEKA